MTLPLVFREAPKKVQLHKLLRVQVNVTAGGSKAGIHTLDKIGNREIVGHGWNGSYCYADRTDYPFPSVRFREATNEICALREKETGPWKNLSIEEKKQLYRYSFCQTFAEMKAPTGEWKVVVASALFCVSIAYMFTLFIHGKVFKEMPASFDEESQKAQLKRMIALEVNPITGLASKWDYERNRWK